MTRLLYLDDEKWQSEQSVSLALKVIFGYHVTNCFTIEEADALLLKEKWDAAILDIGLNSRRALRYAETSFVILEKIRQGRYSSAGNPPTLPVIFASGVWDMIIEMADGKRFKVAELRALQSVGDEFCVRKPIEVAQLHRAIQKAMGNQLP